jgi:hypothetical protein
MNATAQNNIKLDVNPSLRSQRRGFVNHQFTAWLPEALLAPKIGEFIGSRPMQVLSLTRHQIRVRVGRKRRFWSKPSSFDANVELLFHREPREDELTRVEVRIRSNKRTRESEFRRHCGELLQDIHKCLLAHELDC